jgi:hypothetical protein
MKIFLHSLSGQTIFSSAIQELEGYGNFRRRNPKFYTQLYSHSNMRVEKGSLYIWRPTETHFYSELLGNYVPVQGTVRHTKAGPKPLFHIGVGEDGVRKERLSEKHEIKILFAVF